MWVTVNCDPRRDRAQKGGVFVRNLAERSHLIPSSDRTKVTHDLIRFSTSSEDANKRAKIAWCSTLTDDDLIALDSEINNVVGLQPQGISHMFGNSDPPLGGNHAVHAFRINDPHFKVNAHLLSLAPMKGLPPALLQLRYLHCCTHATL
jgi:hypothetical protein